MKTFQEQKFNIGKLVGISEKTIEEHLKLYAGYVKNSNDVIEKISQLSKEMFGEKKDNAYVVGELFRRFSFEYNGMRNHEVYFDSLSSGAQLLADDSELKKAIIETCGSIEIFLMGFKNMALTRGVGWAMLWYDKKDDRLLASWVDEQHIGQLSNCAPIIALDMWEHSFVADYQPSGKKQYVEDFFTNLNWEKVEKNFENTQ